MRNQQLFRRQFRLWAIVLIVSTVGIFTTMGWYFYAERTTRRLLYDYHLTSLTYASAMYGAYSRATLPLGLKELTESDIDDDMTYVGNIMLEYEQILKYGDEIFALDREFANPQTAQVIDRLQSALGDLRSLGVGQMKDRLKSGLTLSNSDFDIDLLSEQLFRIHRAAFLEQRRGLEAQEAINSAVVAILVVMICTVVALFWFRTFRIIDQILQQELSARRASMRAQRELQNSQGELERLVDERTLELQRARDKAERASAAKSRFLSRMSHELRTPLNIILGFGQLLKTDPKLLLNEKHASYVGEIVNSGQHLLEMVNEVLDLQQVERGILPMQIQPVEVAKLVEECVAQIQPMAEQRGISTGLDLEDSALVLADPTRFKQVLLNLLSNAVKYGTPGGTIGVAARPGQGHSLRISVRDTGPGIPAESMPLLFTAFERIRTNDVEIEGTGIGLALSKQLVTTMDGEIGAESEVGIGSTFWFELPRTTISNEVWNQSPLFPG